MFSGDGEHERVLALLPDHVRQDSSARVDEPVADLEHA